MILSIVTLNYNKSHLTVACMESLYNFFHKEFADGIFELIIVDNASPDNSVENLQKTIKDAGYKNVHLIDNKSNDGFGKGCNIGAKTAKGNYILFLNNDTVVKDTNLLQMIEYMDKNKNVAILGGQLTNPDGSPQPSVGSFYTPLKVFLLLAGMQRYGLVDKNPESIIKVDWVKGGLLMIRKEVFKELHGFDEKIFMYTEDMELCYRAKLYGYSVYFYPYIKIYHKETGSSNRTFAIVNIYKNLLYFYKKHRSYAEYLFVKTLLRSKALTLIGLGRITKNSYYIQTYEQALKAT